MGTRGQNGEENVVFAMGEDSDAWMEVERGIRIMAGRIERDVQ